MTSDRHAFTFVGRGEYKDLQPLLVSIRPFGGAIGPWRRWPGDEGVHDHVKFPNHPANYRASLDLADAVNTAIALEKPLLLTGNPGTGKSQLSERIAWEFNLGPVLRFPAQSLSEANDLFYRFDLVGHLAAVEMFKSAIKHESAGALAAHLREEENPLAPEKFVKVGPLGEAILRSLPTRYARLFNAVFGPKEVADTSTPRPGIVLIDEIDKASRDFPNDLLNGIERLEFRIRELGLDTMTVDHDLKPIVIITSNSERELPPAFLRRCTFFHIDDPTQEELEQIIAQRFFSAVGKNRDGSDLPLALPDFYRQLLDCFVQFRTQNEDSLQYRPGTSEIIDWTSALMLSGIPDSADLRSNIDAVKKTASSVSKHKEDHVSLRRFLEGLRPAPAT